MRPEHDKALLSSARTPVAVSGVKTVGAERCDPSMLTSDSLTGEVEDAPSHIDGVVGMTR